MSEKHFKSLVENALCGCQFGVKLGKIGDTVNEFRPPKKVSFVSGSGRLCQILSKLVQNCDRESTDRQTDTHTHTHTYTHRDHTSDLIICPMLCYSNGTDNKGDDYLLLLFVHIHPDSPGVQEVQVVMKSLVPLVDHVLPVVQ